MNLSNPSGDDGSPSMCSSDIFLLLEQCEYLCDHPDMLFPVIDEIGNRLTRPRPRHNAEHLLRSIAQLARQRFRRLALLGRIPKGLIAPRLARADEVRAGEGGVASPAIRLRCSDADFNQAVG